MARVGVVDYGLGNLPSVTKALERVGAEVVRVAAPADLHDGLAALVLPGVGHFGAGARNLAQAGLVEPLREWAGGGRPLLGICLGLQLLFERSEEDFGARGLGIVAGEVRRLAAPTVPHMGWNTVEVRGPAKVLSALGGGEHVYFVHSFYVVPEGVEVVGVTDYGQPFCSAIEAGGLVGTQFHPEKSGAAGLRLLRRFLELL